MKTVLIVLLALSLSISSAYADKKYSKEHIEKQKKHGQIKCQEEEHYCIIAIMFLMLNVKKKKLY